MATPISGRRRSKKARPQTGNTPNEVKERIDAFRQHKDIDGISDEALKLARILEKTQNHIGELAGYQEALREEIHSLTAYEHYSVTITNVSQNGHLTVEVAGLGNARMQIAVHPDIDPTELIVGACGRVTRERNCLIEVTDRQARWQDIARFERYLDSNSRILLKDRDSLIAVDMAHDLQQILLQKGDLIGFDRDVAGMAYERLETPKGDHLFDENVTDDFQELGGLDKTIERIKKYINFRFLYPDLAEKYLLRKKCCILLSGPPGNGKTKIARCCAGYIRQCFPNRPCRFMHVSGSSDYNMWLGESEQKIIERFQAIREAAANGLVILFWDEVDAIAKQRGTDYGSGAPDRILNTFLSQIDGIVPLGNTIIIYATNRPDTLDPGLLRPGRTDIKIEIPAPNRRAAAAILRCYLGHGRPLATGSSADALISPLLSRLFAPNGEYAEVAHVKFNDGRRHQVAGRELLSGAMFENVVHEAARQAAEREASSGQEGVTEDDLLLALQSELVSSVALLAPGNVKSYVPSIPQDAHPIAVEPVLSSVTAPYSRSR